MKYARVRMSTVALRGRHAAAAPGGGAKTNRGAATVRQTGTDGHDPTSMLRFIDGHDHMVRPAGREANGFAEPRRHRALAGFGPGW